MVTGIVEITFFSFAFIKRLGQLFGACYRTGETFPLCLPPMLWKMLVGENVSWKDDFVHIDEVAVRNTGIDSVSSSWKEDSNWNHRNCQIIETVK